MCWIKAALEGKMLHSVGLLGAGADGRVYEMRLCTAGAAYDKVILLKISIQKTAEQARGALRKESLAWLIAEYAVGVCNTQMLNVPGFAFIDGQSEFYTSIRERLRSLLGKGSSKHLFQV